MRVVEKADTGVLALNADFQKVDESSCGVALRTRATGFSNVKTSVIAYIQVHW